MNVIRTLLDLLLVTGATWVLWLLIALSVLSIALIVERAIFFAALGSGVDELCQSLRGVLAKRDLAAARRQLGEVRVARRVEARIAMAGLQAYDGGADAVAEALTAAKASERTRLERRLAFLGTLGNNAPFIGLFGTVVGIIKAFHDLALDTSGGAKAVMGGISEALVATAMGLFVALPAVIAYNYFQRRIKALLGASDALSHTILSQLRARPSVESRPYASPPDAGAPT